VTHITARLVGALHIVGVSKRSKPLIEDIRKEAIMLSMFRSDWFLSMLAGFAIGATYIVFNAPALPIAA
jgi:hypothetical protein